MPLIHNALQRSIQDKKNNNNHTEQFKRTCGWPSSHKLKTDLGTDVESNVFAVHSMPLSFLFQTISFLCFCQQQEQQNKTPPVIVSTHRKSSTAARWMDGRHSHLQMVTAPVKKHYSSTVSNLRKSKGILYLFIFRYFHQQYLCNDTNKIS